MSVASGRMFSSVPVTFSTAVPSPQSTVAVRVSSQPASLITPPTVIGVFSGFGPSEVRLFDASERRW